MSVHPTSSRPVIRLAALVHRWPSAVGFLAAVGVFLGGTSRASIALIVAIAAGVSMGLGLMITGALTAGLGAVPTLALTAAIGFGGKQFRRDIARSAFNGRPLGGGARTSAG